MPAAVIEINKTIPRYFQIKLNGNTITAALDPNVVGFGAVAWCRDTSQLFEVTFDPLGVAPNQQLVWTLVGGSGGFASSKYWVNVAGTQPTCMFSSIQAAIDAANADFLIDGNAKDVFVLPGTYTENVTLRAGVNVIGLQSSTGTTAPPIVNGTLGNEDVSMAVVVKGIAFIKGCATSGSKLIVVVCEQVQLSIVTGVSFLDGNSHAGSAYSFFECNFDSDAANFAIDMGATGSIICERCKIGTQVSGKALRNVSASASFTDCTFQGSKTMLATATATVFVRPIFDTDVNTKSFILTALSVVTLVNALERGIAPANWTGTGTIKCQGVTTFTSSNGVDSTIVTSASSNNTVPRLRRSFTGAGPYTVSEFQNMNMYLPTPAGLTVANLPALSATLDGAEILHKNRDPVGSVIRLTPAGADTIDGAANLDLITGVRLVADRTLGQWIAFPM